jgi:hypothetical protein
MFGGLLFGILLILWGLSQITETIFNLHIPVFGIIFGLFFAIYGNRTYHWVFSLAEKLLFAMYRVARLPGNMYELL